MSSFHLQTGFPWSWLEQSSYMLQIHCVEKCENCQRANEPWWCRAPPSFYIFLNISSNWDLIISVTVRSQKSSSLCCLLSSLNYFFSVCPELFIQKHWIILKTCWFFNRLPSHGKSYICIIDFDDIVRSAVMSILL